MQRRNTHTRNLLKPVIVILLFFAGILTFRNSLSQPVINSIDFEGNYTFSDYELKNAMVLKVDKQFSSGQFVADLRSIREKYRNNGFLFTQIKEAVTDFYSDSSYVNIKITIAEGSQTKVGEILIEGNRSVSSADILGLFETKPGDVLDNAVLNSDINALLEYYEKKGNLFTKAFINDISVYEQSGQSKIRVKILVQENEKVKISKVKITGNEDTNESVIMREVKLGLDKSVTGEDLKMIKYRLEKLNIFETVEMPKIYTIPEKNESGLLVQVKEGNTNTFDGIIGYVPPANDAETGYFMGLVNLSFRNLFGTARRFEARWQQESKYVQDLELKYGEPSVFGLPLNLGAGFYQRIQDTSYTRRKFDLKGDVLIADKFTLGFSTGIDRVIPPDDTLLTFRISDSRIIYAGTDIVYDSRDNIFIPQKGIYYKALYIYGDKSISDFGSQGNESFSLQRYSMIVEFFSSFFERQSLLVRLFAGEVKSGKLEEADLFLVGGLKNIRGYREDQFYASRLAYGTAELRYSLSRRSFASVFFDPGYYYRPSDDLNSIPKQEGFIFGYGLGVRLETAIGMIGVSYAVAKGDGLIDGKIHFGLINNF